MPQVQPKAQAKAQPKGQPRAQGARATARAKVAPRTAKATRAARATRRHGAAALMGPQRCPACMADLRAYPSARIGAVQAASTVARLALDHEEGHTHTVAGSEVAQALRVPLARAGDRLRQAERAGLVERRREGKRVRYRALAALVAYTADDDLARRVRAIFTGNPVAQFLSASDSPDIR